MERIKDDKKIDQILSKGEVISIDPSGYKYSICALCPKDDNECLIASLERNVGQDRKITRVTFCCPICRTRFDASPDVMFLR